MWVPRPRAWLCSLNGKIQQILRTLVKNHVFMHPSSSFSCTILGHNHLFGRHRFFFFNFLFEIFGFISCTWRSVWCSQTWDGFGRKHWCYSSWSNTLLFAYQWWDQFFFKNLHEMVPSSMCIHTYFLVRLMSVNRGIQSVRIHSTWSCQKLKRMRKSRFCAPLLFSQISFQEETEKQSVKKKYKKYISFAYSSCLGCQSKYKHINHITSFSYSHSAKSS